MFSSQTDPRGYGRIDRTLSSAWVGAARRQIAGFHRVAEAVDAIALETQRAVSTGWHLMIVAPGAEPQAWHRDAYKKKVYLTCIFALTEDGDASGTEFKVGNSTHIENHHGGLVVFSGGTLHRGTAHHGPQNRIFLYAVIHTGNDPNV